MEIPSLGEPMAYDFSIGIRLSGSEHRDGNPYYLDGVWYIDAYDDLTGYWYRMPLD